MTPFQQKQLDLMRQMESALSIDSSLSQLVAMQSDYANDPQLTLTCITKLPKNIIETIQTKIIAPLKSVEPAFYYYPDESLHITIQNIRVVHDPPHFNPLDIAKAQKLLAYEIPKHDPFTLTLQGILSMPTSTAIIALVSPEYDQFVRTLRTALNDNGIPDDKKYFTDEIIFANTTICRYTHAPSPIFLKKLHSLQKTYIGKLIVKEVALVETNAGAHPSKTTIFGTYRFKNI